MKKGALLALKFVAVATLSAAVVGVMLLGAAWADGALSEYERTPWALVQGFGFAAVVSAPFVLVGGLLFGIPVHLVMNRRGVDGLLAYLAVGLVVGMVAANLIMAVFLGSFVTFAISAPLGGGAGLTAALLWWLLAVRPLARETPHA